MINERLEDIQNLRTHQEKAKVYGEHFQERLQAENPQRNLVGRMAPGYSSDLEEDYHTSTFYLVGEEADIPRNGLGKILSRYTKKQLRVLVRLNRHYCFGSSAIICDPDLRNSAKRIMVEQDKKSGENYSFNTRCSTENYFFKLKQVKMPSCEGPFL